jgi:hypothetical protein
MPKADERWAAVTTQLGGSRRYARSRVVTLGERLLGSFPVQCKLQERSCDPAILAPVTIERNDAHCL